MKEQAVSVVSWAKLMEEQVGEWILRAAFDQLVDEPTRGRG